MKGTRKQKKCGNRCQEHLFEMHHLTNDAYFKQDTNLLFCPKHNLQVSSNENFYPEFNRDGKFYSPAFILSIDKKYYHENDQRLLADHKKKIIQYSDEKREILVPKPSRKHKYCSVCRNNYQDYLDHIRSVNHKKSINQSKYNEHVADLCKNLYNNQYKTEVIMDSDKVENSELITQKKISTITISSTNEIYENPPTKKRKLNSSLNTDKTLTTLDKTCQSQMQSQTPMQSQYNFFHMWSIMQEQYRNFYNQNHYSNYNPYNFFDMGINSLGFNNPTLCQPNFNLHTNILSNPIITEQQNKQ